MSDQSGFYSNRTWNDSSSFSAINMLNKFKEASQKMRHFPTSWVMTNRALFEIQQAVRSQEPGIADKAFSPLTSFSGIPIESYATPEECIDRMRNPREGERLELVVSEDFDQYWIDRSWMMRWVGAIPSHFSNIGEIAHFDYRRGIIS